MHTSLIAILLLLATAITVECVRLHPALGKVQILSLSDEKMRVVYRKPDGTGLRITTEANDDADSVSVMTLDSTEEVISAHMYKSTSDAVWSIKGRTIFLLHNETAEGGASRKEYVVPEGIAANRKTKDGQRSSVLTRDLLGEMEEEGANETRHEALAELLEGPELDLMAEASEALGNEGIRGYENQAAMNFHGLALHYFKLRAWLRRNPQATENTLPPEGNTRVANTQAGLRERQKRHSCDERVHLGWGVYITVYHCECHAGESNNCRGMCGPGCTCWWWTCGDCCRHEGCYQHDICCNAGYLTPGCAFPVGFSCSSYTCY